MKMSNLMIQAIHVIIFIINIRNPAVYSDETDTFNTSACTNSFKKLTILPGLGWDNLQSKPMSRVLMLNYSRCKTTEDGFYLIPDQVHTVHVSSSLLSTQYIDDWRDYQSVVTQSFGAVSQSSLHEGSFTSTVNLIKQRQLQKLATMFVQMRVTLYKIEMERTAEMTPLFKTLMLNAADALVNNDTRMAEYILEYVVRDYGTHFVTSLDTGGFVLKEDLLSMDQVTHRQLNKKEIATLAIESFFRNLNVLHFGYDGHKRTVKLSERDLQIYDSLRKASTLNITGGSPEQLQTSIHNWQYSVPLDLAAISYQGDPLHYLITYSAFPSNIPNAVVDTLRLKLRDTVATYYTLNTRKGCTDIHDHNFDYSANDDDGSCGKPFHEYLFGGMYQTCTNDLTRTKVLCSEYNLNKNNPLTSAQSCPDNYFSVLLTKIKVELTTSDRDCWQTCEGWIFQTCKTHCRDYYYENRSFYYTYWCASVKKNPSNTGYLFGGLYSSWTNNVLTKGKSCPANFNGLQMWRQTTVCVSMVYGIAHKYSGAFGGFFSSAGNPMATDSTSFSVNEPFPKECPAGYVTHTTLVSAENVYDYLYYCMKAKATPDPPLLIRPPFTISSEADYMSIVNESMGWEVRKDHDSEPSMLSEDEVLDNETDTMSSCSSNLPAEIIAGNATDFPQENVFCRNESEINLGEMNSTAINVTKEIPKVNENNWNKTIENYDNETTEIFDFQNEATRAIANATNRTISFQIKTENQTENENGTLKIDVSRYEITGLSGENEDVIRFSVDYENGTILICSNSENNTEIFCVESGNETVESGTEGNSDNESQTEFLKNIESVSVNQKDTEILGNTSMSTPMANNSETSVGDIKKLTADSDRLETNKNHTTAAVCVTILLIIGLIALFVYYRFRKSRLSKMKKNVILSLTPI